MHPAAQLTFTALVLTSLAFSGEAAPAFAQRPSVARAGDKDKILFSATRPTDCAVYILNLEGSVVRHLAAGALGEKAPEPLRPGLAQSLEWDGKDDFGKPAVGGPFKVRVGLGLKPVLDGFIGDNPARMGGVIGLTCDSQGQVYVFHIYGTLHPADCSATCAVFSRDGKYLRTIIPYPANLPEDKLKGLRRVELPDGRKVPFIYQIETRSLLPGMGNLPGGWQPAVTADGKVVFAGLQEITRYNQVGRIQVAVVGTDGSTPPDGVLKTVLAAGGCYGAVLAAAPDGKTFYAAYLRSDGKKGSFRHCVYKFALDDKEARPFIGDPATTGANETLLNSPKGLAVDKDGNLYVADSGNNRVAVFKPDGKFLGALTVESPDRVQVHPGTGAVYVLSVGKGARLRKFASWKDGNPVATLEKLPCVETDGTACLALDSSATPAVLWYGIERGYITRTGLLRIEDRGNAFGDPSDITKLPANGGFSAGPVQEMTLDRQRGLLYIDDVRFDLSSGKATSLGIKKFRSGGAGMDGNLYSQDYPHSVSRYGPDLRKLPFTEAGDLPGPAGGTFHIRGRGVTADRSGNVYVLWEERPKDIMAAVGGNEPNHLCVYGPDGKLKKERLVEAHFRGVNSPRLDPAGNIYLLAALRPGQDAVPPELKGRVPEGKTDPDSIKGVNGYPMMYGSVVKFGPEGGGIMRDGGDPANFAYGNPITIKGAKWVFSGASPVPSWRMRGTPDICLCEGPRFDVDGFGRSFFPDAGRFQVGVLDTAGNLLCWFGSYGNPDSGGAKSAVPVPEIPLWWVQAVAVDDAFAYLGDRLSRRVVRVKLGYAAEETVTLP